MSAVLFLRSETSFSSGFGEAAGPPGFRAEPAVIALDLAGEREGCPLRAEPVLVVSLGSPFADALISSAGDFLG